MQTTVVRKIDESNIDLQVIRQAGRILQSGGLVAFPTETVYGLAAGAGGCEDLSGKGASV